MEQARRVLRRIGYKKEYENTFLLFISPLVVRNMKRPMLILILLLVIRAFLYVYRSGGLLAYLLPSLCWFTLAIVVITTWGTSNIFSSFNKSLSLTALLIALFQVVLLIDGGLLTKFGRSPIVLTPVTVMLNTMMITTYIMGVEFSRAYLLRVYGKKKITLSLLLMSLFHSPTIALVSMFLSSPRPLILIKFMGSDFLPELAKNLLASYLAFLAGPLASLAYVAPLKIFQWYSPILPDLPWSFESLIGVMAPVIGFIVVDYMAPTGLLRRLGLRVELGMAPRRGRGSSQMWMISMALIVLLGVWFNTGLLGVFPSIAMSSSMRPILNVGDVAILIKASADEIKLGDIIQYRTSNGMVLHRVIAMKDGYFITKGDACGSPDPDPVHPSQVMGKVTMIIPKIGWASIMLREAFKAIWTFLMLDLRLTYMISAFALSFVLTLYLRKRKVHRRRRRFI